MQIEAVDVEGAVRAYLTGVPGLCGAGNPVRAGFHLGNPRSPSAGVIGGIEVGTPRTVDDTVDTARVTVRLRAVGSEDGARGTCETAARATANALNALNGVGAVVTTARGDAVRVVTVQAGGPAIVGDVGGEVTYAVDATVVCQPGP